MSYKVLFDGNGSGIIQVVGLGLFVPAEKHNEVMQKWEQAQAECDALAKEVDAANDRIGELERDEPNHDDIVELRKALGKAAIVAPDSDEELGIRWLSHVRQLIRSVSKWGFVAASERDASVAQNKILLDAVNLAIPSVEICYNLDLATFETLFLMREAVKATPQQCLHDALADIAEKYYYMGWEHSLSTKAQDGDHYGCGKRLAKEFADQVRQGGAA